MLATFSAVKRAASPLMGLARNTNTLRTIVTSHRFQSSSSWSNNNNSNLHDMAMVSDNISANATLGGLHRVDLAHGSFFALHRPLLGITNGPMFAQNFEEFEGKCLLFYSHLSIGFRSYSVYMVPGSFPIHACLEVFLAFDRDTLDPCDHVRQLLIWCLTPLFFICSIRL